MGARIFYFTGTGNSLVVARNLAERLGAELVPIAGYLNGQSTHPADKCIGIVYPVYNTSHDGLPLIIHRFVSRLDALEAKYVFAVCTCGTASGDSLQTLAKLLSDRGGTLAAGFSVVMPSNVRPPSSAVRQQMLDKCSTRCSDIADYVLAMKSGHVERISPLLKAVLSPLGPLARSIVQAPQRKMAGEPDLPFGQVMPLLDRGFSVSDDCTGCATCASVCPVDNIQMVAGKPTWLHHCENCVACTQWCPRSAIKEGLTSGRRYRHPDIAVSDMLGQKRS